MTMDRKDRVLVYIAVGLMGALALIKGPMMVVGTVLGAIIALCIVALVFRYL